MTTITPPLRKKVALALDGGGIKGIMVARALVVFEEALGQPLNEVVDMVVGTSTGSIIAAGLALRMSAKEIFELYQSLGARIFPRSWRTLPLIDMLVPYRYPAEPLEAVLKETFGDVTLGELNLQRPDFSLIVTATDVYANKTRFIKSYKKRYSHWMIRDLLRASAAVPTYFPVFEHSYTYAGLPPNPEEYWIPEPRVWVDGGVGSYSNPCYMAAYEIAYGLAAEGWDMGDTTLISLGTGRDPLQKSWSKLTRNFRRQPTHMAGPEWILPTIQMFMLEADYQQMRLVRHFFVDSVPMPGGALDFRRYNIEFAEPIGPDDVNMMDKLTAYGEDLGWMILQNMQEDIGEFGRAGQKSAQLTYTVFNRGATSGPVKDRTAQDDET